MPAPAVIPAPKAYINAVAVKGFVVELRAAQGFQASPAHFGLATLVLAVREHQKQRPRDWYPSHFRMSCMRGGARDFLL